VFKNTEVLKDASWSVTTGDRVGLVGANGGGKTTQLKVLAGELEPTSGDVVLSSEGVKIAYLKQEFSESLDPSKTLREELASVFVKEAELLRELSEAEDALAAGEDGALEKFEELQQKAQDGDALNIEVRSRRPAVPSRHRRDSCPSHDDVGGLLADFEAVRTDLTGMLRAGPGGSRRAADGLRRGGLGCLSCVVFRRLEDAHRAGQGFVGKA